MKRYQTTFTFKSKDNAERFRSWLNNNRNDQDYCYPLFHNIIQVSTNEHCVEYSAESDFARGVATGIDLN